MIDDDHPISELSQVLADIDAGVPLASERLLPLVYDELRKLAAIQLANERPGQTLQPTALVHEAFLRLTAGEEPPMWKNQSHFFGAAAIAIRRILVENARRKKSLKRGGGGHREFMEDEIPDAQSDPIEDIVALDDALTKLAQINPEAAKFVELHYFSGVSRIQAAAMLSISSRSADRLWAYARAWLRREMTSCDD